MKVQESKFGAPQGHYPRARFLGVYPFKSDKPRIGDDGKPMGPAVEWQFRIQGGPYDGQEVGRLTAEHATFQNSCGTLLGGLIGRPIQKTDDIDPNGFIDCHFAVTLGPSRKDPNRTQVILISRIEGESYPPIRPSSAAGAAPPPPRPANGHGQAPPPPPPQKPAAPPAEKYWVCQLGPDGTAGEAELVDEGTIKGWLKDGTFRLDQFQVMKADQSGGWQPPNRYGLDSPF